MGHSLGLACYLAFSERAEGFAAKQLAARLEIGKEDPTRIDERRGIAQTERPDGSLVWFHAASVGESLSILELIRRLGDLRGDLHFLITTGTLTSAKMIAQRLPDNSTHQFVPVDARRYIRKFLTHWRPDLAVWTESELWPALMHETAAECVPMVLINARISRATYTRWRWFPGIAKSLLRRFDYILAQDQATAKYLRRLGMPTAKTEVIGTLKEGSAALPHQEDERVRFAKYLAGRPVWLAASTHEGEDELVAAAHKKASRAAQRLLLIIAPRHPDRGPGIEKMLRKDGWKIAVRSKGEIPEASTQIYLADTLGEMGLWYRIAPVSFLGGSLVDVGGHNPFEPAALGSAIIHGPYVHKVADIYARLAAAGATVEVKSVGELVSAIGQVLSPDKAASMAHAAWEVSSSGAEVTDRALDLLLGYLPPAKRGMADD
ncbi:MAG: 3-deoxy-D-manno-octulosonic acid transferase [Alphaproteobacteria bacterium]|nr:3-deoxy-D-manno-octulosonic acid transferase [Alphaproteobacteria bacterium]